MPLDSRNLVRYATLPLFVSATYLMVSVQPQFYSDTVGVDVKFFSVLTLFAFFLEAAVNPFLGAYTDGQQAPPPEALRTLRDELARSAAAGGGGVHASDSPAGDTTGAKYAAEPAHGAGLGLAEKWQQLQQNSLENLINF